MANEVGTASNLEDLFGKIVSFLTTNPTLVAADQHWTILRQRRDNIAALTTNLNEPSSDARYRTTIQTCRYDPRSLNINNENSDYLANFYATNYSSGVSHVTWQLRTAREVKTVRLRAPLVSGNLQYMLRNFRLQYSDNGTTWTTALTVNSSPTYALGETKDWAVPGTPGSHLYWRILMDSIQGGSTSIVAWMCMLLLEADGTVANHFGSEVIFKARGNAGTDEIYCGIRSEYYAAGGWYNLFLNGYTGFDPNEQSWFKQPGALNGFGSQYPYCVPMVPCWNTTMPYWFVASGRSFRFAVKVSTSYEGGYLGFILPYATPGQYPYPLAVGGSLVPQDAARSAEWRYSYANWRHGVYPGPGVDSYAAAEGRWATLYLRNPDGEWRYFGNRGALSPTPESIYGPGQSSSAPYAPSGAWRSVWPHCMNDQWLSGKRPYRECLGGGYILQPCVLLQRAPYSAVFGELEGTYAISGYQNAPENTTTWNGKTVVVFQHAYRNTVHEFWALSLD
jgi:hypothetical protein